nr:A/G-specific adenine glycosylase [Corynebacterium mendelii]
MHRRQLAWRTASTSPWGVLVSEVMSQQTPVARVEPAWRDWMRRWPTPTDLAAATPAEVITAWGNLGYPRRALRLKSAAETIAADHANRVPEDLDQLLALPGIGDYTARAVACFAHGHNVPVVDTNVRRVIARLVKARPLAGNAKKSDLADAAALLPDDPDTGPVVSVALMELGALVCTAAAPQCGSCPVAAVCAWVAAGQPEPDAGELVAAKKRVQKFTGTDRQVRGKIMAALRGGTASITDEEISRLWPDGIQLRRCLDSLISDGLAEHTGGGRYRLPQQ